MPGGTVGARADTFRQEARIAEKRATAAHEGLRHCQNQTLDTDMSTQSHLILCDLREDVTQALERAFSGVESVSVRKKDITRIKYSAFATAGNSFGDMGGGVDKAIDDLSRGAYQRMVQERIRAEWFGELPVGAAVFIQPDGKTPGLIYAPTMRVPGNVNGSVNAYLGMRAILTTMVKFSLPSVSCAALGTGVGGLTADDAADQMYQAHRMIVKGE
jgi:O-acetyl-ADP-ribose deacetylase (regulator of RNase III)